jgi:hypothetical protein
MDSQRCTIDDHTPSQLLWPCAHQVILVVFLREGEHIHDVFAADGEEVDGEAQVVEIPGVKFVPPGVALLEMVEEGIVGLSCGGPAAETRSEGVIC